MHLHIAIRPPIPQLKRAPDLLWKGPRISVSCVVFVISMILMKVFACPYSFVNISDNSCSFLLFHFYFTFYYPIVNITVNHRYLVFFRSRKTNTNCCDKNEKNTVIWSWRVTSNNAVSKNIVFWSIYEICKYIDFTHLLYKIYLNRWHRKN